MLNQRAQKKKKKKPLCTFNFWGLVYKKWAVQLAKQEVIQQAPIMPRETSPNMLVFAINKNCSYNLVWDRTNMVLMSLGIGLSGLLLCSVG